MLSVMGPFSRDLLYRLLKPGDKNDEILSNDNFPFATNKEIELLGADGEYHKLSYQINICR